MSLVAPAMSASSASHWYRRRGRPGQHLHHLYVQRKGRSHLLAERRQGRRPVRRLLRWLLGQQADAWNESGVEYNLSARRYVATGSSKDGTADQSNPLGASSGEVQLGCLYQTSSTNGPVWCNFVTENIGADDNQQLYGLSGVFQVTTNNATGKPVITGTPEVKQTLTADISGIMDTDGLPADDQFSYQWIRSDGTDDSDISGATDSTYELKAADLGKTIKVKVTFTDGGGTEETLTSDATTAVAADTTGPTLTEAEVPTGGVYLLLTFDEFIDRDSVNLPPLSAFTITADGIVVEADGVSAGIFGEDLFLSSLSSLIRQGQKVIVTYTDPTAGNDTAAIQDEAGNDAADFTTGEDDVPAVTNNSTETPVAPGALVSNIGQTDDSTGDLTEFDQAQAFTTGTNSGGYTLESVEIDLSNTSPPFPTHTVSIWTDSSGSPGASGGVLTPHRPASPRGHRLQGVGGEQHTGLPDHLRLSQG